MESSAVVSDGRSAILIDVTRDFVRQAVAPDLVILTHAHRDACGGIRELDRRLSTTVPVLAAASTIRRLRARYRRLAHLELHAIASRSQVAWRGWRLQPIAVPHALDCTTFAWRIARAGGSLVYASDVARLTPRLRALCDACDLLVLDGAMWERPMFTHLEIRSTVPIVARWRIRRLLFTQLGRSTPAHGALDRWLHAADPRFGAAYDGLVVCVRRTSARKITGTR